MRRGWTNFYDWFEIALGGEELTDLALRPPREGSAGDFVGERRQGRLKVRFQQTLHRFRRLYRNGWRRFLFPEQLRLCLADR